ncbi:MAG: DMT family transporter [Polyangiaceae bacterium]
MNDQASPHAPAKPLDLVLVVVAAAAFATSSPLAKAITDLDPLLVGAGRCLVAASAIMLLFPRDTVRRLRALSIAGRWRLVGAGALLALHFGLFLFGLSKTSLSAAASLVSLEPLAVVLGALLAFGVRPTARELGGVLLAAAGAAWIGHGAGEGENRLVGDLSVVGAVAVYGAYVMTARAMKDELSGWPYAAAVYFVAAVFMAPLGLVFALHAHAAMPAPRTWLFVVLLGLVPTMIGHTLVQRAARHVHPSIVALISPGETVGSIAIGIALEHTVPTRVEWSGAALVLCGVVIAVVKRRAKIPIESQVKPAEGA